MKPSHVAAFAAAGMMLVSFSVYSLTPMGGFHRRNTAVAVAADETGAAETTPNDDDPSHFAAQGTLNLEGRLGQAKVGVQGEEFVLVDVTGSETRGKSAAPVNLSLVIDRSGSMRGTRIRNAVRAATAAVERLREGDTVSVVTFDTSVQVVVPPTEIGSGSRDSIDDAIRHVGVGGDTCISCGVEQGAELLGRTSGKVNRMILLSDGDANHGVRDLPGFRAMAQRARDKGITIATIGVDVEYNEKVLSAIAEESNGKHYFVENDEALARVFEREAATLTSTLASDAAVAIELAPGVALERVFERSFRRAGNKVIVPLGAFAAKDAKSVLLKVRMSTSAQGRAPIANVELTYNDLVKGGSGSANGALVGDVVADSAQASALDASVEGRIQRSETVQALKEANVLFERGRFDEAKRKVSAQQANIQSVVARAKHAPPAAKQQAVNADLDRQLQALGDASSGFAQAPSASPASPFASPPGASPPPAAASRAGQSAVRRNQEKASDLAF